jgi:hypothetical protein
MTEADLILALRTRFPANEYALVSHVRGGAGWDRRTFDAVAVGLWASRGHPVHGFECKTSRSDWRRELAKPEKADPLVAFCHYWWVVAPPDVVDLDTLPDGWGLLEARGGKIYTVSEAPKRAARAPTMGLVAQLAKRLLAESPASALLEAAHKEGFKAGVDSTRETLRFENRRLDAEVVRLKNAIHLFEEVSGLRVDHYSAAAASRYAEVVRVVMAAEGRGFDSPVQALRLARLHAQQFIERTDALFEEGT